MIRKTIEEIVEKEVKEGRGKFILRSMKFGTDGTIEAETCIQIMDLRFSMAVESFPGVAAAAIPKGSAVVVNQYHPKTTTRKYSQRKKRTDEDVPASVKEFKQKVKAEKEEAPDNDTVSRLNRFDLKRKYDTNDEDIRIMKIHLSGWKSAGKMTAEQKKDLELICGAWASKLPQDLRDRCLKLFNDIRKKLGIV